MLDAMRRRTFKVAADLMQVKAAVTSHRVALLPIAQELDDQGKHEAAECVRTAIAALEDAKDAA